MKKEEQEEPPCIVCCTSEQRAPDENFFIGYFAGHQDHAVASDPQADYGYIIEALCPRHVEMYEVLRKKMAAHVRSLLLEIS